MSIVATLVKRIPLLLSKGNQNSVLQYSTTTTSNISNLLKTKSLYINKPYYNHIQIANFSKYTSKARAKRIPLNTKRVGKGYKKGYGARREGMITRKGKFIQNKDMLTELVVPDLKDFKLKPYVGAGAKRNVIDNIVPKL